MAFHRLQTCHYVVTLCFHRTLKFVVLDPPRLLFQTKSKTVRTRNFSVLWSATDIFSLSIIFVIHNNAALPPPPPSCRKILLRPFSCDIEVGSLVHASIITNKGALTGSHWSFFLIVWSLLYKSSTAFSASALVSTASQIVLYFVSCNNPNSGHYFTRLIDSYGLILKILLLP